MKTKRVTGWQHLVAAMVLVFSAVTAPVSAEEICVTDDMERLVCLDAPAERIVALSPGTTELLFQAGAGDRVVGTTSFSDYPEAAAEIPRVGSYKRIDLEALLVLEPDLVIAWISGNPVAQVERLESLGLPVFWSEPRNFQDVADSLRRYGRLAGTWEEAESAATSFQQSITAIREQYEAASPVPVFYQVWEDPLMTVNGEHLISRAIELCGADNVFADLERLAPRIDIESVLEKDPEAILAGGMGERNDDWLKAWEDYPELRAVKRDNLFFVPPSSLQRPTLRILDGIRVVCEQMEQVRERR